MLSVQAAEAVLASSPASDYRLRWAKEDPSSSSNAVGCVSAHLGE
jgi:hypothetical protein